jgi:hypothetical protein
VRWEVVAKSAASCNDPYFWLHEIVGFWGGRYAFVEGDASRNQDSSQTNLHVQ